MNKNEIMIKDFYNRIIKLIPYKKVKKDYIVLLTQALNDYFEIVKNEFGDVQIVKDVKSYIDEIIDIANKSYNGSLSDAYEKLSTLMKKYENYLYDKSLTHRNFYRMRIFEDRRDKISYRNMFHVPLSMRRSVRTQRYSSPGYPCLYMGWSVYGCWEELGRPKMSDCWVSRIELKETEIIKLLDLRVPNFDTFTQHGESKRYIILFPLIISCMIQQCNPDDIYKPEYIIPQLIIEWIISKAESDGVIYTSVKDGSEFNFPKEKMNNIAIPVKKLMSKSKYCPKLASMFYVTEPINNEIEKLKVSGPSSISRLEDIIDEERNKEEKKYRESDFGFLEMRLEKYIAEKIN